MASPTVRHQAVLGALYLQFAHCIEKHPGCRVYFAPLDVRLDRDQWTMVQPDLFVICRQYDLGARAFEGAPDLTLEILSPSTRAKDMLLKLYKYQNAGVKEYWIVDPQNLKVLVYLFEETDYPENYTFHDVIPVGISRGSCTIDFERIYDKVKRYL